MKNSDLKPEQVQDLITMYTILCTDEVIQVLISNGLVREGAIHTQDMTTREENSFWINYLPMLLRGEYDEAEKAYTKHFKGRKTRSKSVSRLRKAG